MSRIYVLAGDFSEKGQHRFVNKQFAMQKDGGFLPKFEAIPVSEIDEMDVADEESVKKIWGTVAGGAVGAVLLGPLGLLAGVLAGGNRKEVTFVCRFKDGRKMMAKTKNKVFQSIQAARF